MATSDEIALLRAAIGEPDDSNGWTDEKLGDLIDSLTTVNAAALNVWQSKAASFSSLVDVSESGSSRSMSQLFKNAQAMATYYGGLGDGTEDPTTVDAPVISRIRRGF